jgi:hypothetical protein
MHCIIWYVYIHIYAQICTWYNTVHLTYVRCIRDMHIPVCVCICMCMYNVHFIAAVPCAYLQVCFQCSIYMHADNVRYSLKSSVHIFIYLIVF